MCDKNTTFEELGDKLEAKMTRDDVGGRIEIALPDGGVLECRRLMQRGWKKES